MEIWLDESAPTAQAPSRGRNQRVVVGDAAFVGVELSGGLETLELAGFRRWTAGHVPRAQNRVADALANEAIDRVLAGGPASVVIRPPEG